MTIYHSALRLLYLIPSTDPMYLFPGLANMTIILNYLTLLS